MEISTNNILLIILFQMLKPIAKTIPLYGFQKHEIVRDARLDY
jgi:hypothetical protein